MEPSLPEMGDVFELRIQLLNIEPEVWRRLLVPAEVPLGVLHEVIQVAFGWQPPPVRPRNRFHIPAPSMS